MNLKNTFLLINVMGGSINSDDHINFFSMFYKVVNVHINFFQCFSQCLH